ncbi:hypothetical protein Tco_1289612, partial [Tanacetum coccineum]
LASTLDEGTCKSQPLFEGPATHPKDSGGHIPPTDMEPIHPTVADLSDTSAKYQVDQTKSTRLRYQSLTEKKDVIAFLLSDDEAQESEEDILRDAEEMDEEP